MGTLAFGTTNPTEAVWKRLSVLVDWRDEGCPGPWPESWPLRRADRRRRPVQS